MDHITIPILAAVIVVILTSIHWVTVRAMLRGRIRAEDKLRHSNRELTLIYEAGHELSSTLDLDKIYSAIYHFISSVMPCQSLYVSSYDPGDNLIRCLYGWGDGSRVDVSQLPPIPLEPEGQGTQSLVIRTGKPLFLPDYEAQRRTATTSYLFDEDDGHMVQEDNIPEDADRPRSAILVPLKSRGQTAGVIQVFSNRLNAFSENDLRLLEALAVYVTAAITNASLYRQAQNEIGERKQVETALRESEEKFRTFIEQSADGITLLDEQGCVIEWNPAREKETGLSKAEVIGKPYWDVQMIMVDPAARSQSLLDRIKTMIQEALQTGASPLFEKRVEVTIPLFGKEGRTIQQMIFPIKTDRGYRLGSITRDISEQKRAEAELQQRDTILEAVSVTSKILLMATDWRQVMTSILETLSQIAEADRGAIFQFNRDEQAKVLASTRYLWQMPALPPAFDYHQMQNLDLFECGLGFVYEGLSQNQPMSFHVREISGKGKEILTSAGTLSSLHLPIFLYGSLWGSLHFSTTQHEHEWSKPEIEALKIAADLLGTVNERKQAEEELARYRGHLEELAMQRTAELRAANEQLLILSHLKDEFVSNVSHELRTPITSIKLRQYLLEKHPEQVTEHLEVIGREIERLGRTIEDLLQLSRLDQGRVALSMAPLDLNILVGQVVTDRSLLIQEKNLSMVFQEMSEIPAIMADAGLLAQVLSILLTNAISYTPSCGKVAVQVRHQKTDSGEQWAGFSVSDTGVGIPLDEQQQLFTRFFRGAAGRKLGVQGTGLGLAIAKEIVDRHSGRIEILSDGIAGHGTTFTVWLPVSKPDTESAL